MNFGFETYLSPFTTRYGSREMRQLHSQLNYYASSRDVLAALARAQSEFGLVSAEEMADIDAYKGRDNIDPEEIRKLDRTIKHDFMAHVKAYTNQCKTGGGKLNLGGTSMDTEDNVDVKRARDASDIIITRAVNALDSMRPYMEKNAETPCVAWTHLQPAGYTTVGYRFANYAQDLLLSLEMLEFVRGQMMKGKGMKGIAGTSSSYVGLLGSRERAGEMEKRVMEQFGLDAFPVATQVYPRITDFAQMSSLAMLAAGAHKFAFDLRILSSPIMGEMYKIPDPNKVGSSAAPWKIYNPTEAERINSLARYVAALPQITWTNAGNNLFERTLDDSANRRIVLAEGYLASDQIQIEYDNILRNLGFREGVMVRNVRNYGIFMNAEPLMMEGVKRGANRQEFHEAVRRNVFDAYEKMLTTGENPLPILLGNDQYVSRFFDQEEISQHLSPDKEIGEKTVDASYRTRQFLNDHIYPTLERHSKRLGIHAEPEY